MTTKLAKKLLLSQILPEKPAIYTPNVIYNNFTVEDVVPKTLRKARNRDFVPFPYTPLYPLHRPSTHKNDIK